MDQKLDLNTQSSQSTVPISVGIISISDRASAVIYDDLGGLALKEAASQ